MIECLSWVIWFLTIIFFDLKILNNADAIQRDYLECLRWAILLFLIIHPDSIKINRPDHSIRMRMYWTNFDRRPFIYNKIFWHLLPQNWSIFGDTVSLWSMSENRQFTVMEVKCTRFRNSSECLKVHCDSNNWPIWMKKVPKEAWRCGLQIYRVSIKFWNTVVLTFF